MLHIWECGCAAAIRGVSPPPDEPREGRRTLPWRSLSAPKITTISIYWLFCRATGSQIWAVLPRFAFAGIPASSTPTSGWPWGSRHGAGGDQGVGKVGPAGRGLAGAVPVVIKGLKTEIRATVQVRFRMRGRARRWSWYWWLMERYRPSYPAGWSRIAVRGSGVGYALYAPQPIKERS